MPEYTNIAFKEWAIVVEALGRGEQILILRKGGIHEQRGQFRVAHSQFWLFPTRYHEDASSVIPSKRPALRELAARASATPVDIQFFAEVAGVHQLTDLEQVRRLQGRHIWSEPVLRDRFEFGREPGLHALVVRVSALPTPARLPLHESYAGCKSWVELKELPAVTEVRPVLDELAFQRQYAQISELMSGHALAHL